MGIWKAKEKELVKIKTEKANLKKMQKQFKSQKSKLIKSAVEKNTRQYKTKMKILRVREQKIKSQADKRVAKAFKEAHVIEHLKFKSREMKIKKKLEKSIKKQTKAIKLQAASDVKLKYRRVERSLKSTLSQFKGENSKLSKKNLQLDENIKRLEKQLAEKTTPQIEGLLYEKELMKQLKKLFKHDKFVNTGKGGDIVQTVVNENENVGTIVYECKRVKNYVSKHVKQTYDAQHKRKAEFGVLVTNAMKKGTNGFFIEKGVIIVHSTGVLHMSIILRKHIVHISDMKLGQMERDKAIKNILGYLENSEFTNSIGSIIQDSISLYKELMDEIKKHYKIWKERYGLYSRINSEATAIQNNTRALLSGKEIKEKKISMLPALAELPEVQDEDISIKTERKSSQ
ncbi:MAG: hypothetical protein IIC67_11140 [Thaumarchaeota archaeon]|nr:hypothetical protein [Nitrososphaerota archaeon]